MGAMASAFQGLGAKGPLGGMNKAIGSVGGKIGLPGMSSQGVPGFKAKKPGLAQQVGQLGQLGATMGMGATAGQPGMGATAGQPTGPMQPPGAGAAMGAMGPMMQPGKLTPQVAMSGAQSPAGMFPAAQQGQGQGDQSQQNPWG